MTLLERLVGERSGSGVRPAARAKPKGKSAPVHSDVQTLRQSVEVLNSWGYTHFGKAVAYIADSIDRGIAAAHEQMTLTKDEG